MRIRGLHHVTAIAGEPSVNVSFYTDSLGLRLVKRTVNFDDPGVWHLYYGDDSGTPGSILTFFPFQNARPGREGVGSTSETALSVAPGSLEAWLERFADLAGSGRYPGFDFSAPQTRFGEQVLRFRDPDGLSLALVERQTPGAFGTFDGVTLCLHDPEPTAAVLTQVMGLRETGIENGRRRFETEGGSRIDLITSAERERKGAGTVHHIAFRAADDEEQRSWQERLRAFGIPATEVKDRQYFRSIYFREPGGVLFEIATDPPGFSVDESVKSLGQALKLPTWLEPRRAAIEQRLPSLDSVPA